MGELRSRFTFRSISGLWFHPLAHHVNTVANGESRSARGRFQFSFSVDAATAFVSTFVAFFILRGMLDLWRRRL